MRLIDADALKETFLADSVRFKTEEFHISAVETEIASAPTIDAVPVVHGQWIEFWDEARGKRYGCSICAASAAVPDDYCTHCGAIMDAPDGSGV